MEAIEALVAAVKARDLDQVRALVDAMPILATMCTAAGEEPLMTAIYFREQPIIDYLRAQPGGDSFLADCALGERDRVAALVAVNPFAAKITAADGHTPLGLACFFGHDEVAGVLIAAGADVNRPSQNAMKVAPLNSAAAARCLPLVERLLAAGADPNVQQQGGYTALHQAAHNGLAEIVRLLLAKGADPGIKTEDGRTALDFARVDGHAAIAALLEETIAAR